MQTGDAVVIGKDGLDALVSVLAARGRTVIGPTVRDGAIVLAEISAATNCPTAGASSWRPATTGCDPARTERPSRTAPGPQSWKTFLHPQRERQWTAERGRRRRADDHRADDDAGAVVRVPRGAPLRPAGHRGAGPGADRRPARRHGLPRRAASGPSWWRWSAPSRAPPASACPWAPGPAADRRLRPGADRGRRRRGPPLPGAGGQRGGRRRAGRAAAPAGRRGDARRRRGSGRRTPPTAWAARCRRSTCRMLMREHAGRRPLERRRGTLPDLRQLHHGLPHLLLHHHRGRHRPHRRPRRAVAPLGVLLRPGVHPPARRTGPCVRHAAATASGPPTNSAPGTTSSAAPAASAAAGASCGARSASTSPRRRTR